MPFESLNPFEIRRAIGNATLAEKCLIVAGGFWA